MALKMAVPMVTPKDGMTVRLTVPVKADSRVHQSDVRKVRLTGLQMVFQ